MKQEQWVKIEELLQGEYRNITGLMVAHKNKVVYEKYNEGYTAEDTIHVASVTKSIMSLLIGIAIDKGYIQSVEQKVLEFFPEYQIKRGEKTIQHITLYHLLTMTAPYKYKHEPYTKVYSSEDWTKAALDLLGGKGCIGEFKYSTVGMQILSGVLTYATGQSVRDFAIQNLFAPLGMSMPQDDITVPNKEAYLSFIKGQYVSGWIVDPQGVHTGGWGLTLTPRDMMKLGQLCLNDGGWENRAILSKEWMRESTKAHSQWGTKKYGYLWWLIEDKGSEGYAAIGDGGNIIYVIPSKQMVVAIASQFMPRAKDRIELIQKHIIPYV
ncbi:MAG: serine hydrolase domain-containing protein [Cellulosilyticaceae bacterium]